MKAARNLILEHDETAELVSPSAPTVLVDGGSLPLDPSGKAELPSGVFSVLRVLVARSADSALGRLSAIKRPAEFSDPKSQACATQRDELQALHVTVVDAIRNTCTISENGVIAAGAALGRIVEEAMSKGGVATPNGEQSQSSIGDELTFVDTRVRAYIDSLGGLASEVSREVTSALTQCRGIVELANECTNIIASGPYLAMLMKIETSRLRNAQNVALAADEITSFSDTLESLLGDLKQLTDALSADLHSSQKRVASSSSRRETMRTSLRRPSQRCSARHWRWRRSSIAPATLLPIL